MILLKIYDAARKMLDLSDDLLDYARLGYVVHLSSVASLNEVVDEAVSLVAGQINECGRQIDFSPTIPIVFGARTHLVEVYQNLIDDAVKYMGSYPEPRIDIGVRQDGEEVVFYHGNNGSGSNLAIATRCLACLSRWRPT